MAELSAYELERNRTIAENEAKLVELGLESASAAIREHTAAKREAATHEKKERLKRMPPPEPTRASKRVRSEKPQYTGEKIDKFGDEIDAKIEKQARVGASGEEKAAARAAAMEAARLLLEEARAKLQAERGGSKRGSKKGGDAGWRAEAIKRWGARAGECATDDWEGYVASREAKPAPTSPELLLQEHYADDGWKLLVCCALMSRVSSHETKTRCIEAFFALCPTPTAFLEADVDAVEEAVKSLGLFHQSRYRSLVDISTRWLNMPIFDIGAEKGVNKIEGCGPFTVDSYYIFCKDDRTVQPADACCAAYCRWRDRQA